MILIISPEQIHHTMSKSIENFYQESGRCGRDGNYAECILLYKFNDISKITTMTFTESNGLHNTYSMVDYCLDAKKCRRNVLSNYFTEVWNERDCGQMCDHCYYLKKNRNVVPPRMNILVHYRTLLKLIDHATLMDVRLTAFKLVDAWLHKGPSKLRVDTPPPSIDRFYAEQIVAYLILQNYLREEFSFTAYSTNSYIVTGPKPIEDDEIDFQPSRTYDLPPLKDLKDFFEATSEDPNTEDVSFVKEDKARTSRFSTPKRARVISSSSDDLSEDFIKLKNSDLEKMIEKSVESKLRKIMNNSETATKEQDSEDVIILSPKKEEVIEID